MERELKHEISVRDDVVILRLSGSLEVDLQPHLLNALQNAILKESDVVVDFREVIFIDSSCLGILVSVAKSLRSQKGDIKLAGLSDDVRSIFQITRLDKIFEIHDSVEDSIGSYYK